MSALEPLQPLQERPGNVADWLLAVARGTAVLDVVKDQVDRLRDGLAVQVDAMSEASGTAFTARVGGVGSAVLTDPQPKVSVADSQAFGVWLAEQDVDGLVESRPRVEVVDHAEAAAIIRHAGTPGNDLREDGVLEALFALAEHCLKVVDEWFPAEDAVDTILSKGWGVIHGDHVRTFDPETGEMGDPIPGLSVRTAKPTLQVRLDKDGREQARAQVREALGLPELDGGDA